MSVYPVVLSPLPPPEVLSQLVEQTVDVTVKQTSGDLWIQTGPIPVICSINHVVFTVAEVDRRDLLVPYLLYDDAILPYWTPLFKLPRVQNGCEVLELTVVFQPKEHPIGVLFEKAQRLNDDGTDMSFEEFKKCLTDPGGRGYLNMESLMFAAYPMELEPREVHSFDRLSDYEAFSSSASAGA